MEEDGQPWKQEEPFVQGRLYDISAGQREVQGTKQKLKSSVMAGRQVYAVQP